MFSSSREQEPREQPFSFPPGGRGWGGETLLRNPFAGSLKFEAFQLQTGGLGGRAGGTGVRERSMGQLGARPGGQLH